MIAFGLATQWTVFILEYLQHFATKRRGISLFSISISLEDAHDNAQNYNKRNEKKGIVKELNAHDNAHIYFHTIIKFVSVASERARGMRNAISHSVIMN
jgi:hypothetical protein